MKRIFLVSVIFPFIVGNIYACGNKKDFTSPEISSSEKQTVYVKKDSLSVQIKYKTKSPDNLHQHKLWDELTKKHVTEKGFLDYQGIIKDYSKLNKYLQQLSANHPNEKWSSNQRKAYWINAYNAFTVKLIIDNYPVKSIKDLGGSIYRINTPWDIKFIKIGDAEYHLNDLEHNILRKEWEDARIHAAVNCASVSCPRLRAGAFTADKLESQLDEQMRDFINDETKNVINEKSAKLSKLFKWFSGDFKNNAPSVIAYINKYSETKLSEDADIDYLEYDWNLNDE